MQEEMDKQEEQMRESQDTGDNLIEIMREELRSIQANLMHVAITLGADTQADQLVLSREITNLRMATGHLDEMAVRLQESRNIAGNAMQEFIKSLTEASKVG